MKRKGGSQNFIKYLWFLGFLGFRGFKYFTTSDPLSLFWFSYFSFFAYYFVGKMADQMPDERYIENSNKAKQKVVFIPLITLFAIGFFSGFSFVTKELIVLAGAFGWAITIISYAFLFWYYDTH